MSKLKDILIDQKVYFLLPIVLRSDAGMGRFSGSNHGLGYIGNRGGNPSLPKDGIEDGDKVIGEKVRDTSRPLPRLDGFKESGTKDTKAREADGLEAIFGLALGLGVEKEGRGACTH